MSKGPSNSLIFRFDEKTDYDAAVEALKWESQLIFTEDKGVFTITVEQDSVKKASELIGQLVSSDPIVVTEEEVFEEAL